MYYSQAKPGVIALLMRHGKTALNDPGKPKVRGWKDIELSDEGKRDAQMTANRIRFYNPKQIYHSDFMRDSQTAHEVARILNIPAEADFDARTWDVGTYSGKSEDEANPALIEMYKRAWVTPHGSSESFNDFSRRWLSFLENKLDFSASVSRPSLIVTHGRNIALSHAHFAGVNPWEALMPLPAGIAVIRIEPDKRLTIDVEEPREPVIADI